jgi:hypothetical protein
MSDKSFSEEVARIFEQVASPEEWVSAMDILRERFPKTDVDLLVRRLQKERPYREAFDRQLEIEHARTKEWTIPVIEELLATIPEFQASDYFDRGFAEDGLAYAVFDVGGFYSFLAEAMNRRDEPLTQRCFDFQRISLTVRRIALTTSCSLPSSRISGGIQIPSSLMRPLSIKPNCTWDPISVGCSSVAANT